MLRLFFRPNLRVGTIKSGTQIFFYAASQVLTSFCHLFLKFFYISELLRLSSSSSPFLSLFSSFFFLNLYFVNTVTITIIYSLILRVFLTTNFLLSSCPRPLGVLSCSFTLSLFSSLSVVKCILLLISLFSLLSHLRLISLSSYLLSFSSSYSM